MNILKTYNVPENEDIIVIGTTEDHFIKYLPGKQEKRFLKEKLAREKVQITVNLFDKFIFFQVAAEKKSANKFSSLEEMRKAGNKIHNELILNELERITIIYESGPLEQVLAIAEGIALSNYQFLKYFSDKEKKKNSLKEIKILCDKIDKKEIQNLNNLVSAVYKARDLVNEPVSFLTAGKLSEEIQKMGDEAGFQVEVLNKKKIESLKMGGLLAVNKGSIDPPTFSILEYKPAGHVNNKPIVLVGKGIVFDTGGLSLKPTADSMDYMKCDMSGAAAVAGVFYAVALSKLPVHIVGLIPATDNRPDGNAYAPGDVITMYNGATVEVLNTDAEGRLILADALTYAKQYDPELVIDVATLTGAAQAAIGNFGMVGMGNAPKELMDKLIEAGFFVNEKIAEFPFWEEYFELMKSDIADLKNLGGKFAGAITAGKFLEYFTDYPYIHLDIAGPAFNKKTYNYRGIGGSGVGVRLLYDFLRRF